MPIIRGLGGAIRVDSARKVVVGQNDCWADEHASGEFGRLIDESVILDFAVGANFDPGADVCASTYDAILTELGVLAHLRVVPNF